MMIPEKMIFDEAGGEVLEYALIAGLIVVSAIATITAAGGKVLAYWMSANGNMPCHLRNILEKPSGNGLEAPFWTAKELRFFVGLETVSKMIGAGIYAFHHTDGRPVGSIEFAVDPAGKIKIHRFWAKSPGKGHGSNMLRTVCEIADHHSVELTLKVLPIGRKPYPLTREQLFAWYSRHGFKGTKTKMVRSPTLPQSIKLQATATTASNMALIAG